MSTFFIRTPGASLSPLEKAQFEDAKRLVTTCTNDMLIRPDLNTSIELVDIVNGSMPDAVMEQVVFLLRTKVGAMNSSRVVKLSLSLLECLVKNCKSRFHNYINDKEFMNDMMKVARKYTSIGMIGSENREVAELCLDIVQAWGEAFLPHRKRFPNIVKAYHDLRKEGLPFKQQYDTSSVPIFTPSLESSGMNDFSTRENVFAASLSSSFNDLSVNNNIYGNNRSSSGTNANTGNSSSKSQTVESLKSSIQLLMEVIKNSHNEKDARDNDLAIDIKQSITATQMQMSTLIEEELIKGSSDIDKLLHINDVSLQVLYGYNSFIKGELTFGQVKGQFSKLSIDASSSQSSGSSSSGRNSNDSVQENTVNTNSVLNLLSDYNNSSIVTPTAVPATVLVAPRPLSSNNKIKILIAPPPSAAPQNKRSVNAPARLSDTQSASTITTTASPVIESFDPYGINNVATSSTVTASVPTQIAANNDWTQMFTTSVPTPAPVPVATATIPLTHQPQYQPQYHPQYQQQCQPQYQPQVPQQLQPISSSSMFNQSFVAPIAPPLPPLNATAPMTATAAGSNHTIQPNSNDSVFNPFDLF